ncbi:hypothetical protein SPWS13_0044 [Shewanella putrefaciens]|nr:hypothetical protein SPWS13_0044 [Shewanella putrefaciens]
MILAKVQTSAKQRDEFRLLVAIRFACLIAVTKGHQNPMDCPRVQQRCNDLVKHLAYNHPSPAFHKQFFGHAGELGNSFSLRFTEPKQVYTAASPFGATTKPQTMCISSCPPHRLRISNSSASKAATEGE